jgi:hypothetical protein
VSAIGTLVGEDRRRQAKLDERLRRLGYKVPPHGHQTRLVHYVDGSYGSALIRCGDDLCAFCNPPPRRRLRR